MKYRNCREYAYHKFVIICIERMIDKCKALH